MPAGRLDGMVGDSGEGWRTVVARIAQTADSIEEVEAMLVDGEVVAGSCAFPRDAEPGVVIVARRADGASFGLLITTAVAEELSQHLRRVVDDNLREQWKL